MSIVFFTLSDSFTCFVLISHPKSLFYFLPAEFSDFPFDTLHEILHKRIWQLILSPCLIFGYLIDFRARSKIFLQYFFSFEPNIFELAEVQDNLVGCGLSSEIGVFRFIPLAIVDTDFSQWHFAKSTQTIVNDQSYLINDRSCI